MIATHIEHKISKIQVYNTTNIIITCYKTVPKTANYEGKLKKWGGSQVSCLLPVAGPRPRFDSILLAVGSRADFPTITIPNQYP